MSEQAKRAGERLEGFERLITHLATHFINVPTEKVEAAVELALQKIGEFAQLHRVSIVLLDENRTNFTKTYEWCAPGVKPAAEVVRGVPVARYPWIREKLMANQVMLIRGSEDFPVDAPERLDYDKYGVGSALVVPMMTKEGPIGCFSFSMEDLKMWSHEDLNLLEIAAEVFVNVFERQRTEELAMRYAKELERSNEDLVEFAYHASHDLQEPLRMVSGYCELLDRRCAKSLDGDSRDLIQSAISGTRRMQELVSGLLLYSRIGAKRGLPHSTDCETLLQVTLENLEASIRDRGAQVSVDRLPIVVADTMQLGQVFQNLISNAIKFARGVPRIHVGCEEKSTEFVFFVRDKGIGIDPNKFDRIFEAFVRLHSGNEYPGTGIGLSICKKIVERHGGRIWVESAPGEGSVFYFTVPRRDIELLEAAAVARPQRRVG
jgi:signal transduction histidine kinase